MHGAPCHCDKEKQTSHPSGVLNGHSLCHFSLGSQNLQLWHLFLGSSKSCIDLLSQFFAGEFDFFGCHERRLLVAAAGSRGGDLSKNDFVQAVTCTYVESSKEFISFCCVIRSYLAPVIFPVTAIYQLSLLLC